MGKLTDEKFLIEFSKLLGLDYAKLKETRERIFKRRNDPIDIPTIARGIELCLCNAKDLYEEALILFDKAKYARCISLSIVCEEEIGKIAILRRMAQTSRKDKHQWHLLWTWFYNHAVKGTWADVAKFPEELKSNPFFLQDFSIWCYEITGGVADKYRQICLYVDRIQNEWNDPRSSKIEDAQLAICSAKKALDKEIAMHKAGFYAEKCLRIYHEVYSELKIENCGSYEEMMEKCLAGC